MARSSDLPFILVIKTTLLRAGTSELKYPDLTHDVGMPSVQQEPGLGHALTLPAACTYQHGPELIGNGTNRS
jgi:hypothetical protein